jgi:capsule polysaccharide export protein KpsC/LpsZ
VSDQGYLISAIAKSTPCTHDLYVKPHPDHIGGRSRAELLELAKIPGVRLISPHLNSHDLIQGASIVLTPTGTMAMESAFFRVPSIVFADEFFKAMPFVHHCRSLGELPELIPRLLSSPRPDRSSEMISFLAYQFANSFAGRYNTYIGPYSEEELTTLVHAYSVVYDRLRQPRAAPALLEN